MHSLGKSFQRSKQAAIRGSRAKYRNLLEAERDAATLREEERHKAGTTNTLRSIWETSNLEEFLLITDAQEKGYEAARDLRVVVDGTPHIVTNDKIVPQTDERVDWLKLSELLTIPRRPTWSYEMRAEEVQALETSAFFDWRRRLARIEEEHKVVMTPYEKNLEVWRQLWRVVERADIVLFILDARNPLVFRCADFESYVRSTLDSMGKPKEIILLLNKADLLTEAQRQAWAEYFTAKGEAFVFFSARPPVASTPEEEDEDDEDETDEDDDDDDERTPSGPHNTTHRPGKSALANDMDRTSGPHPPNKASPEPRKERRRHHRKALRAPVEVANPYELAAHRQATRNHPSPNPPPKTPAKAPTPTLTPPKGHEEKRRDPAAVLGAAELLDLLATRANANTPLMAGLVGYPNVGKSSTINAILGAKRVVVSATPGKTKHFQTLSIPNERRVALCDCPGLVFPSFASTRAQMVCDGILPIDTATEAVAAAAVLCRRVPRCVLEWHFGVALRAGDDVDDSHSLVERFLHAVARRRGYMGAHDRPNKSRAARDVLKLYVDGSLVYVEPPPSYTAPEHAAPNNKRNSNHPNNPNHAEDVEPCAGHSESDGDDWEDMDAASWGTEEADAWEDLDSAAHARALSEDGSEDNEADTAPSGKTGGNGEDFGPMSFFARPRRAHGTLTRTEAFNAEANTMRLMAKAASLNVGRRKRRTNHQLEPDETTFVNAEGEVELVIDDDDGIVQLDLASPAHGGVGQGGLGEMAPRGGAPRQKSKRQTRREQKRAGNGPINPTARRVGVQGYDHL